MDKRQAYDNNTNTNIIPSQPLAPPPDCQCAAVEMCFYYCPYYCLYTSLTCVFTTVFTTAYIPSQPLAPPPDCPCAAVDMRRSPTAV